MPRGNRGVAIAVAAAESGAWKGLLAWEATSTGVHCARSKTRLPTPRAQPLPGSPPDPEWQLLEPVSRRGSRVDEFSFGRWLPSRSCYDSTASLIRRLSTSKFPLMDKGPSISTHRKPHTAKAKKADDKLGRNTNQSIQHWGRNNSRAVTVQKRLLRCLTFSEAVAIIHLHLHDFDHVNVATTLSLLSKFQACSTGDQ